jgi:parvulin-like peptidyl-prolyl isomerase
MAKTTHARIISKKHLARQQREQRQTTAIITAAIVIIAAVILLIGYGILDQTVLQLRRPAVTVNGDVVTMREFQLRVRVQRQQLIDQYLQYYQFGVMLGIDPTTDPSLSEYMNGITSQLNNSSQLGSDALLAARDAILIRQYAAANGLLATAEEIEEAVYAAYQYYPLGSPTPTLTPTSLTYATLSSTQLGLMTPTITLTPAPTRTLAPSRTPDLSATPTAVPSPTPSATPYTLEGFQSQYELGLAYYGRLKMNEEDYRRIYFEERINREKVTEAITVDVPYEQEQVWARHILVADQETALSVRQQLSAGADFAALAAQYSIDTSNKDTGGDLNWFGRGRMVAEFETAAFDLEIGELSQPVQSQYGFHIIQVLGHEVRPLTESEHQTAVEQAFENWLQEQREAAEVVFADDWLDFIPEDPTLEQAFDDIDATRTAVQERFEADQQTLEAQLSTPAPTPTPE